MKRSLSNEIQPSGPVKKQKSDQTGQTLLLRAFVDDIWKYLRTFLSHPDLMTFSHASKETHALVWKKIVTSLSLNKKLGPYSADNIDSVKLDLPTSHDLPTLFKTLTNLTFLDLHLRNRTPSTFRLNDFLNSSKLKTLEIYDESNNFTFNSIVHLPSLQKIYLMNFGETSAANFEPLQSLTKLRQLRVMGFHDHQIEYLPVSLQTLTINTKMGGHQQMKPFSRLTNLHHLHIESNTFTDFDSLQYLKLTYLCTYLPKGGLHSLRYLPLIHLESNSSDEISSVDFTDMKLCETLRALHLRISGVKHWNISSLKSITTLSISKCGLPLPDLTPLTTLQSLDLALNNLRKEHVGFLTALTNLRHLNLQDNNRLGCIPPQIAHLRDLTSLDLSNCIEGMVECEPLRGLTCLKRLEIEGRYPFSGFINEEALLTLLSLEDCDLVASAAFLWKALQLQKQVIALKATTYEQQRKAEKYKKMYQELKQMQLK